MKRRNFIQSGALISVPLLLNGNTLSAISKSELFTLINDESDKVIVLIQLNGGNDGLNTFIPIDQYSKLAKVRSNVLIPEQSILPAEDINGFHPSMTEFKKLYDDAKLSIIQNVGYPNQNRSHFKSTDIWTSGATGTDAAKSGWLGRYLERDFVDFPTGFPNDEYPDPPAITMGFSVSQTCQGTTANFSMALSDPSQFLDLDTSIKGLTDDTCYGQDVQFIRESIRQTNAYSDRIEAAFDKGNNVVEYPENRLAEQLKIIAKLISGGLGTKIYVASLGGFDTHGNQVEQSDTTQGEHADLLSTLTSSISAFQNDLAALSLDERVIGMTFSEFGRRIISNGSFGTDHGTAAPLFIFGSCVKAGVIGSNPEIADEVQNKDGVAMQYDFRSIYGSLLVDWFKVSEDDVKEILFDEFQYINLLNACEAPSSVSNNVLNSRIEIFPNPCVDFINIKWEALRGEVRISLYDSIGSLLKVISEQIQSDGSQTITVETRDLLPGNYALHLRSKTRQISRLFTKQ